MAEADIKVSVETQGHKMLEDGQGNFSSKRTSSFICILTAVGIGIGSLVMKAEVTLAVGLVVSFLGAGLALQGIAWGQELAGKKKLPEEGQP